MAWERLTHKALTGAADSITTDTFAKKDLIKVLVCCIGTGQISGGGLQFNDDTGSNYSRKYESNGGSGASGTSETALGMSGTIDSAGVMFHEYTIVNRDGDVKLLRGHTTISVNGSTNAPDRREVAGKWSNYSSGVQIEKIKVINNGSGDFAAGSYITVFGAKEAETTDTITVDSLEAKKHLVVQAKLIASGSIEAAVRFNNDSGNNYSTRYGVNGSESTGTSKNSIDTNLSAGGNEFATYNIINVADEEKLVIGDLIDSNTAGASNHPSRVEVVGKWANTSNAITRVDLVNVGSGDFAEGSEVTVYGTD